MPDLKDVSLKQAGVLLNSYGLKVGRLIYKPDLAQNAVLDQMINGKSIKPGDFVSKGSTVDLVLGDGVGLADIEVPVLVGLTLAEAKFVLDGVGLNLGAVVADNTVSSDSLSAYIFRQIPDPSTLNNMIKPGEPVDVFISNDQSKVPRQ
jgi:beta-lactam-binding protein with PASTA domain